MKKMLLKFADNLLSREQMKEVKGGHDYCAIKDRCEASIADACGRAATNFQMYVSCTESQRSQCNAMFGGLCYAQFMKQLFRN